MAIQLQPPPYQSAQGASQWASWYREVNVLVAGAFLWTNFDFTGSNLTDLVTRNHNDLQTIQGGTAAERYHLTQAEQSVATAPRRGGQFLLMGG